MFLNLLKIGTLNLNDDSILGYDLYSSALAEILSEPSLGTPITVVNNYFLSNILMFLFVRVCMLNGVVENRLY
jgi:hypothetical protein